MLPVAARAILLAWAESRLADARGCYAASWHGDEAAGMWEGHARRLMKYAGPISELVTGHLVYPDASIRVQLLSIYAMLSDESCRTQKSKRVWIPASMCAIS